MEPGAFLQQNWIGESTEPWQARQEKQEKRLAENY
jgi:hypothetical protein